jgi:hypothetical protein
MGDTSMDKQSIYSIRHRAVIGLIPSMKMQPA